MVFGYEVNTYTGRDKKSGRAIHIYRVHRANPSIRSA